ncbi:C2H2-type domain-containing protein [Psidium guajava]|nr:C2H2-type domain-containing protein [Psidium guajava]
MGSESSRCVYGSGRSDEAAEKPTRTSGSPKKADARRPEYARSVVERPAALLNAMAPTGEASRTRRKRLGVRRPMLLVCPEKTSPENVTKEKNSSWRRR